jgi:hypothetical protein
MRRWKAPASIFVMTCVLAGLGIGEDRLKIEPSDIFPIGSEISRALQLPVKCDAEQNVYFRPFEQGGTLSPVFRVSAHGDKETKLSATSEPAFKAASVQDFTVAPDGSFYELIQAGKDVYVARFMSDGTYQSKTKLDKQLWGAKIAVTGSMFLVSGSELPSKIDGPPKLFTAFFDLSGRLVKPLAFDRDPADPNPQHKPDLRSDYVNDTSVIPLVGGNIEADRDGKMLLMRASAVPAVFVLDASGKVVGRFQVDPPMPGMSVAAMHVHNGKAAFLFQHVDNDGNVGKRIIAVTSATGEKLREYSVADALGTAFACFADNSFGFITTQNNKLAIQYARPE